jgi:hypothetical protein
VSPKRFLLVQVLGLALAACELMTGLEALHETAGGANDATGAGDATPVLDATRDGGDEAGATGDGALDDGAIEDVRALSDVLVPAGYYLLHVGTYRAHVTSDIPAIECPTALADGAPPLCDAVLLAGTQLVLTTSGSGEFDGWAGDCEAALYFRQCTLVMTSDKYVFSSFSLSH